MEFDGTEKRIQALFSELSLADQRRTPRFEPLWTPVEKPGPAPLFRRSLAVPVVVIAAAISFVLWSSYKPVQSVLNIAPLDLPTLATPQPNQLAVVVESPRAPRPRHRRSTPQRQIIADAALLSQWQSPTQSFMQSTSVPVLNSLPQLNQSAKDLESFLPKKESNQ